MYEDRGQWCPIDAVGSPIAIGKTIYVPAKHRTRATEEFPVAVVEDFVSIHRETSPFKRTVANKARWRATNAQFKTRKAMIAVAERYEAAAIAESIWVILECIVELPWGVSVR